MKKTTKAKLEALHQHPEYLEIKKNLIIMVSKTANMKLFYEKVLADPEASERAKNLAKTELELRDYGKLEQEFDPEVAKKLDEWMEKKILKMIEDKELPKSNFLGLIRKHKQLTKKQYELTRSGTGNAKKVGERPSAE